MTLVLYSYLTYLKRQRAALCFTRVVVLGKRLFNSQTLFVKYLLGVQLYVDLLYIPPLAPQPDMTPLGGTIVYYETVESDPPESRPKVLQIRSQSYISPNNVLVPAGTDPETGVDRQGVRETIPDELTAYSRVPASPDYRPDPQDVDEGIETSDDELDTSPAIMQVY